MAGQTSGDRPDFTNGAIEGQQNRIAPDPRSLGDDLTLADRGGASADAAQTASDAAQTSSDADQTSSDAAQTASDADQTSSDADQSSSDAAQGASDSDQAASDSDQAASDRDLEHGGDADQHELARGVRERTTRQRHQIAQERAETAAARDAVARARDLEALARDRAAALRDRELAARDVTRKHGHPLAGILLRAAENRRRAAGDRSAATEARMRAAADREQAARDREQAARDRSQALADRDALLHQLDIAETDQLTGTRTRAAGLADLDHEIDRARRTTGRLVVAYVDVVALKAVNDAHGHAAGDALLQRAVHAIRDHLRSYDLIVRLGGDEFLCVMSDATIELACTRFLAVQAALGAAPDPCEIRVGFAMLAPEDSAAELIKRADAELPTRSRR